LLTKYYSGDQIKKNEMAGACIARGEEEGCIQGFGGETCGNEMTLPRLKRGILLKWIFLKWDVGHG
jgi:hypothetical protein